ncbi:MAG: aminopeptidase P N-terminal domain-containing protein [Bdellovibrionales bacterium]
MRQPSFDMKIFKDRRHSLASKAEGAAIIMAAHPDMIRNHDVHHPYRQDSHFLYLTGFEEPESVLVFRPKKDPEYVLFVRNKDPLRETWDGFRYGPEGAMKSFGADKSYTYDEIETELPKLLADVDRVYYRLFLNNDFDKKFRSAIETTRASQGRSGSGILPIWDVTELLGEMRLKKTAVEAEWMRKACRISAEGHIAGMKYCKPGVNERQVQAVIEHEFRMLGSPRNGYGSIVASGASATTLHYVFNDQECKSGDLLLVDMGAEYNYYTGDITRTYPVNGKFTPVQKDFYDRVLTVQKHLVSMIRPGVVFKTLQDTTIEMLTEHMLELGLLKGTVQQNIEQLNYKKYYPHGVSHWLGMDVHDAGLYKKDGPSRPLESGMVFTVEPGLYVPVDDMTAPAHLRGLGVRIEDNILVTDTGHENMTSTCPKEVKDLEAIIDSAK